jgi:hypothetical protein
MTLESSSRGYPNSNSRHPRQKQSQLLSEPIWSDVRLKTVTVKRLKYFGKEGDSYDEILNKLMDVTDGIRRRDNVVKEKEWLRSSTEYQKLLPRSSSSNG